MAGPKSYSINPNERSRRVRRVSLMTGISFLVEAGSAMVDTLRRSKTLLEPTDLFVERHIGPSAEGIRKMLEAVGYPSLDALTTTFATSSQESIVQATASSSTGGVPA